jgi:hypothetical protein
MLHNLFFIDEAWFHLRDYINSQKSRICSAENSHTLRENPFPSSKIGAWYTLS